MKFRVWHLVAISAIVIIGGFLIIAIFSPSSPIKEQPKTVFHVTLADPDFYQNGIFYDIMEIKEGSYVFRFVPNGDSPKTLSISLIGESFQFYEEFRLEGTPQGTESAVYYTWDYLGDKSFNILEEQELEIRIDPHGNLLGPVSVDIIEN